MNCRSALRLVQYRTLFASKAIPARPIFFLPQNRQCRLYTTNTTDTTDTPPTPKLNKKAKKGKKATKEEPEIEEAGENALSVKDEANSTILPQLRHQNKNPIPGFNNDESGISENAALQRDVQRRQEQIKLKKREILKRVQTLATMDTTDLEEEVKYDTIEDAYRGLKLEFDEALQARQPDAVYEVITSMRSMGLRLPKKAYDAAAVLFAEEQHIYKVRDMWDFMHRDQVFPDQTSFTDVVATYCNMTQYEWAMRSFFKMCEYLCPNPSAYEQAMELFSKNTHIGNLRKAEQIFHTIHRFDVKHTPKACAAFIRLLCASGYEGDADRAVEVLKYMKAKVIGPVPDDVPQYFVDHLNKYAIPERMFIRAKKVLRGCQHGGLPDEPFKDLWEIVESKQYVRKLHRADMAAPLDKMDFSRKDNLKMNLGV